MRAMKDRTTGVDINIKNDVISLLYICLEKQKIDTPIMHIMKTGNIKARITLLSNFWS